MRSTIHALVALVAILLPINFLRADGPAKSVDYCNIQEVLPNLRPLHGPKPLGLCYTVQRGDTPSNLAKRFYNNSSAWNQFEVYQYSPWRDGLDWPPNGWPFARLKDPRRLVVGSKVLIADYKGVDFGSAETYSTMAPPGVHSDGGTSIYTSKTGGRTGEKYDGPFDRLYLFLVDKKTNNKIYIVGAGGWGGDIQLVMNKERNPYIGPGANFELLTFSPDGKRYAVRTNVRQNVPNPGFIVLSNMGNGPEYDFSDSLIWYNNDTLIYRAQNNDEWRVVVNSKDYKVYDFLENLRVEKGVVKFDARHEDGSWTKEEFRP